MTAISTGQSPRDARLHRLGAKTRETLLTSGVLLAVLGLALVPTGTGAQGEEAGPVVSSAPCVENRARQAVRSVQVTPSPAVVGEEIHVTGRFATQFRRPAVLQLRVGNRWRPVMPENAPSDGMWSTDARGRFVALTHAPTVAGTVRYRVRLPSVKHGGKSWSKQISTPRTVRVLGQAAELSLLPSEAAPGDSVVASARVTPLRKGRLIAFQARTGTSRWITVAERPQTAADGTVTFEFEVPTLPGQTTSSAARLAAGGTIEIRPSARGFNGIPPLVGAAATLTVAETPPTESPSPSFTPTSSTSPTATSTPTSNPTMTSAPTLLPTSPTTSPSGSPDPSETPSDTTPPAVPQDLAATGGDERVVLMWTPVLDTDLGGYLLYRSESTSGPWALVNDSPQTQVTYTDDGLINSTEYFYSVTARDEAGNESARSDPVAARPCLSDLRDIQRSTTTMLGKLDRRRSRARAGIGDQAGEHHG